MSSHPTGVRTFWLEPTGTVRRWLRRYSYAGNGHTCADGYHDAIVDLDSAVPDVDQVNGDTWPHDDPRWPVECERGCGYRFVDDDQWQLSTWHEYTSPQRPGETFTLRPGEEIPGAMWDATWWPWKGPDGRSICVVLPNGHTWGIDMVATNCTRPDDKATPPEQRQHWCWLRHGEPPVLTVDKDGPTCAAGAGSILSGDYHGFLRNGVFEP